MLLIPDVKIERTGANALGQSHGEETNPLQFRKLREGQRELRPTRGPVTA